MRIEQKIWSSANGRASSTPPTLGESASLVLLFGSTSILSKRDHFESIRKCYPKAHIFGCSTAGEIVGTEVLDDSLVVTAVAFEHTQLKGAQVKLAEAGDSYRAGERLALSLDPEGLVHVLVLSDGLKVNGSQLVEGLVKNLPPGVTATGGLSGDGSRFERTLVCLDGMPEEENIAVVGLYGNHLKVGYGSLGGWDSFGPERLVTRSKSNVLYELDGQSALELYKTYLGPSAADLPGSALLFPLSLRAEDGGTGVVRTILGIDEEDQSMIFAGDIPEGSYARLMKANFERLIDGATGAARTSYEAIGSSSPDLAILISCVGRKLVLKQRIEEEVEGVRDVLGENTVLAGFYSYGEISPFTPSARCALHNQTMTITTLSER
jgi:hypothetical protein